MSPCGALFRRYRPRSPRLFTAVNRTHDGPRENDANDLCVPKTISGFTSAGVSAFGSQLAKKRHFRLRLCSAKFRSRRRGLEPSLGQLRASFRLGGLGVANLRDSRFHLELSLRSGLLTKLWG